MLFKDLHIPLPSPPIVWCDNVGALALASNPVFHARTKHVEVDYHFIRGKVTNKDIVPKFISSVDQVADVFTKGLSTVHFSQFYHKVHVHSMPLRLREAVKHISPIINVHLDKEENQKSRQAKSPTHAHDRENVG